MEEYSKNPLKARFQMLSDMLYVASYHAEASVRGFSQRFRRTIMVRRQRLVLAFCTILVIIAGLFPPWNFVQAYPHSGNTVKRSAGYAPLFFPPTVQSVEGKEPTTRWGSEFVGVEINLTVLLAEWITILLATGGLFIFFKTGKDRAG